MLLGAPAKELKRGRTNIALCMVLPFDLELGLSRLCMVAMGVTYE